jgi:hypothetical protein
LNAPAGCSARPQAEGTSGSRERSDRFGASAADQTRERRDGPSPVPRCPASQNTNAELSGTTNQIAKEQNVAILRESATGRAAPVAWGNGSNRGPRVNCSGQHFFR